jgi:SNF2 family DNA or RNA helicase
MRYSALDAAQLARLDDVEGTVWTGGEKVRALGRKLSESGRIPDVAVPDGFRATLERLMEMVAELVAERRKILVFSQFTSMLDLIRPRLERAGIAYALLTGDTRDREEAVAAFQDGPAPVFLISLKAGASV